MLTKIKDKKRTDHTTIIKKTNCKKYQSTISFCQFRYFSEDISIHFLNENENKSDMFSQI
jgi:CRISPR/Cas system CSM-associated protein Csm4 (group 5 of RAMP superfamily)